jgi:hypothetical protein
MKSLVALLTASPEAPLAIHLEGEMPTIWGFLDSTPVGAVCLRIGGAGTVVAISGNNTVALVHEGNVHVTSKIGTTNLLLLFQTTLEGSISFSERMKLARGLFKVTLAMHGHCHGGAIVIAPTSGDEWLESIDIRFRYTAASTAAVPELVAAVEAARSTGDSRVLDAHIAVLDKTLRSIGCLTAINGALVVREDLSVVGFGAKINCPPADVTVTRFDAVTAEKHHERPIFELGGMRHQSAARLVNMHRDCTVIVSSQDGRLTLLAWIRDPGTVVAISGIEHFVWGEFP